MKPKTIVIKSACAGYAIVRDRGPFIGRQCVGTLQKNQQGYWVVTPVGGSSMVYDTFNDARAYAKRNL